MAGGGLLATALLSKRRAREVKIFLMVDNEGMSGVYTFRQTRSGDDRRSEGRAAMTADVNACAEGLKRAGVDQVVVRDCHGRAETILWEQLSPAVDECVMGAVGPDRFFGSEGADGVILLGYHAMAGTAEAFLNHTWSSATVQNMYLNGVKSGELALDAAIAGERGMPVIMVSGDDKLRLECERFLPWAVYAQVKRAATSEGGALLGPAGARALIAASAEEAVRRIDRMRRYVVPGPVALRVECAQPAALPLHTDKPYMRVLDGRSYEVEADTVQQALNRGL